jgi:hypothetical protein
VRAAPRVEQRDALGRHVDGADVIGVVRDDPGRRGIGVDQVGGRIGGGGSCNLTPSMHADTVVCVSGNERRSRARRRCAQAVRRARGMAP